MGLEALTPSTFIAGLTKEWPTAGEPKSQGDDHIRLLKGVLQNTFPNASQPFYLPSSVVVSGGVTLPITGAQQNQTIFVDTTGGNVTATLPALTLTNVGWSCEILKTTLDANAVTVAPPSGSILSSWGAVATVRVGAAMAPARFIWNGTAWLCAKMGPLIGSTEAFDGATIPSGYLALDGTVFNGTTFAELALALGGTTLRDKRGRVEVGVDTGANRLLFAMPGQQALGGVGGGDSSTLLVGHMPPHRHPAYIYDPGHGHNFTGRIDLSGPIGGGGVIRADLGGTMPTDVQPTGVRVWDGATVDVTGLTGSGQPHPIVQPTIVVQKLIRAC